MGDTERAVLWTLVGALLVTSVTLAVMALETRRDLNELQRPEPTAPVEAWIVDERVDCLNRWLRDTLANGYDPNSVFQRNRSC